MECPEQGQQLDRMILMGPFQLRIFCDSGTLWIPMLLVANGQKGQGKAALVKARGNAKANEGKRQMSPWARGKVGNPLSAETGLTPASRKT